MLFITDNTWLRGLLWNIIVIIYKQNPLTFLTMLLNLAIFGWLYTDVWVLCCGIPISIMFSFNAFAYVIFKRKIWLTSLLLNSFNALLLALWTFNVYSNHSSSMTLTILSIIFSSFIPLSIFIIGWRFLNYGKTLITAFPFIHLLVALFLLWLEYPLLYFSFSCSVNIIVIALMLYFWLDKAEDAVSVFTKKETLLIYVFTLIIFLIFELPALSKLEILHNYGVLDKIDECLVEGDKVQNNECGVNNNMVVNGPHPWMKYAAPYLPKNITNPTAMACIGQECTTMYANGIRQSLWTRAAAQFISIRTTKSTVELEQIEKEPSSLKKIKKGVEITNVEKQLTNPPHLCDIKIGSFGATAFVLTTTGQTPTNSSTTLTPDGENFVSTYFVSKEKVQPTSYSDKNQYMVKAVYHMSVEVLDKLFVDPKHKEHAYVYYKENHKNLDDIRSKIIKESSKNGLTQINQIIEKK